MSCSDGIGRPHTSQLTIRLRPSAAAAGWPSESPSIEGSAHISYLPCHYSRACLGKAHNRGIPALGGDHPSAECHGEEEGGVRQRLQSVTFRRQRNQFTGFE